MKFQHPTNGYVVTAYPNVLAAIVAPFYFARHGAWGHAAGSFVAGLFTFGVGSFLWGLGAKGIIHDAYLRAGWKELDHAGLTVQAARAVAGAVKRSPAPRVLRSWRDWLDGEVGSR